MEVDGGSAAATLSPAVAQRALFSLQEGVEVVLQFIEQTVAEEAAEAEAGGQAGVGGGVRHALLLAALRALARCGTFKRWAAPGLMLPAWVLHPHTCAWVCWV